jgi:hypothetical protein
MGARVAQRVALTILIAARCSAVAASDKLNELQARFDSETNSVHKARLIEKLGDAEFAEADREEKAGNYAAADLIFEKYRDNVRLACTALEKDNPDGERHPNGYKQLEMHVQKGLRELDEIMLMVPAEFKPPLQLVRQDLLALDNELLRSLFPRKHQNKPPVPPTPTANPSVSEVLR